ncbi:MAG TPA: hypothetical protein VFC44_25365 [Candidatus Saccharimonadales bacterium]|nr:hypothetical protein [Candidatus Saccharimonadales bacterium]
MKKTLRSTRRRIYKIQLLRIPALVALLAALALPQPGRGAVYTWNTNSGNWSVPADWTPTTGVGGPAATDTVVFGANFTSSASNTVNNIVDGGFAGTVAGLTYNSTAAGTYNVTQIATNLTVNGPVLVGGLSGNPDVTLAYMAGGGSFTATGTNFNVQNYGSSSANSQATLNVAGLSAFTYNNPAGTFSIADVNSSGFTRAGGNVILAGVSNNITAAIINIGTSASAQAGPLDTLSLGTGTNVINVATMNVANNKNSAVVNFQAASGGLTLRGVSGANTDRANIIVGNRNQGGSGTVTGTLALNGSAVNIKAGSLIVGENSAGSVAAAVGVVQFDTGTIDATTVTMASSVSGSSNASGSIVVGPAGTLIVGTGGLTLANEATGSVAYAGDVTGTLTINEGTVNSSGNITEGTAASVGTVTFTNGGILNMGSGAFIGTTAVPINNFNLDNNATLGLSVPSGGQSSAVVGTLTWPANDSTLTINVTSLPAGTTAGSTFPLIQYATFSGTFTAPVLNLPIGITGHLSQSGSAIVLTIDSGGGAGYGGLNELANPSFELGAAGWTEVDNPNQGNTVVNTIGTATYYNSATGACPQDAKAQLIVSHSGTNVAKIYGGFTGGANTASWSQKVAAAPGSTWTAGAYTYVSHEDLMAGNASFYYQVNFLDPNGVVLAAYQSFIVTNLSCGETTPFPIDTWVLLGVTNQMQVTTGTNTGVVIGTVPSGILDAPPNTATAQFRAVYVQPLYDGGSVYFDDANLGFIGGATPPTLSALNPILVAQCTNTTLTGSASSTTGTITNLQVTVQASALGGPTNTTVYSNGSAGITIAGLNTGTATFTLALTTNVLYNSVVFRATDDNGAVVASPVDTFDTLAPVLVIEASDFNFTTNGTSGQFINTPPNGGLALYYNTVGTELIDEFKGNLANGTQANKGYYRTNDTVIVGNASPISGPSPTEQKFVTAAANGDTIDQEEEVGYNSKNDWLDYTRTYGPGGSAPAGTYNIWCYMATVGSGNQAALSQVTSDPTQQNQTTNFLGYIGSAAFSDNGWNNFVYAPLVDQFGNLVPVTLGTGTQTLRSTVVNNPNLGSYLLMPAKVILTPVLQYIYPDSAHPFEGTNLLSFTIGPASGAAIASSGIQLILNGVDVSAAATKTQAGSSWTVTYPLKLNQPLYSGVINVTNTASLSASFPIPGFDTFSISNYQWEASDYDYSSSQGGTGGLYIDNPVPTADVVQVNAQPTGTEEANSYFGYPGGSYGTGAQQGVDVNFGSSGQPNDPYRIDFVNIGNQPATDYLRPKFAAERVALADANIGPFNVGYFGLGYWLNYTRDWPTNNYNVWGRLAGGAGPFSGTTLSLVTNGVGTPTQMTNVLGTFADATASGWQAYHWIPMMAANGGGMAVISLGGQETLKLTSGNNINPEFFMLVPAAAQPGLGGSLVGGALNITIPTQMGYTYTVYYTTNLAVPNWQPVTGQTFAGDGTTHVVTEPATGTQGYYQVK